MDYEKKYKELIGQIKKVYLFAQTDSTKAVLESILPELKENEDERIRKEIIEYIKTGTYHKSWIAWLEKQKSVDEIVKRYKESWYNEGKIAGQAEGLTTDERYWQGYHDALEEQSDKFSDINTPSKELIFSIWDLGNRWKEITHGVISTEYGTQLEYIQKHWKESEYYLKVLKETKFHEGDWIISNNKKSTYQVIKVKRGVYVIRDNEDDHEYHIGIEECEKSGRIWNISDAKDGDVLAFNNNIGGIIICKSPADYSTRSYCRFVNDHFVNKEESGWSSALLAPATKEQRDLLFQKMEESGHKWDEENKILK